MMSGRRRSRSRAAAIALATSRMEVSFETLPARSCGLSLSGLTGRTLPQRGAEGGAGRSGGASVALAGPRQAGHLRHEGRIEGLHVVVVRAELQADVTGELVLDGGQHQDLDVPGAGVALQGGQEVAAVHVLLEVEDDDRRLVADG